MPELLGSALYWLGIGILLLFLYALVASVKDVFEQHKVILRNKTGHIKYDEPFCALCDVELDGDALTSPILHKKCLHYKSKVYKNFRRNHTKEYLWDIKAAQYKLHVNGISATSPKAESCIFVPTLFTYHKKWLDPKLPERLEDNLRQLDLQDSFWSGQRMAAIVTEEEFLPLENALWVCGRIKKNAENQSAGQLVGAVAEQFPIIATSRKEIEDENRYGMITYTTASVNVALFLSVFAYVFY